MIIRPLIALYVILAPFAWLVSYETVLRVPQVFEQWKREQMFSPGLASWPERLFWIPSQQINDFALALWSRFLGFLLGDMPYFGLIAWIGELSPIVFAGIAFSILARAGVSRLMYARSGQTGWLICMSAAGALSGLLVWFPVDAFMRSWANYTLTVSFRYLEFSPVLVAQVLAGAAIGGVIGKLTWSPPPGESASRATDTPRPASAIAVMLLSGALLAGALLRFFPPPDREFFEREFWWQWMPEAAAYLVAPVTLWMLWKKRSAGRWWGLGLIGLFALYHAVLERQDAGLAARSLLVWAGHVFLPLALLAAFAYWFACAKRARSFFQVSPKEN